METPREPARRRMGCEMSPSLTSSLPLASLAKLAAVLTTEAVLGAIVRFERALALVVLADVTAEL